jgi:4'-phosphopantetheinyl transferase
MMIHWSVQTLDAHPDLARGCPPPRLLCDAEYRRFAGLKSEKRRREWLMGRWTAKRLLAAILGRSTGRQPACAEVVIENDPDHAPYAMWLSPHGRRSLDYSLSISHSADRAFCAALPAGWGTVGADIERIEPRSLAFSRQYFTPDELAQIHRAEENRRPLLATATWSAKEAALKALRLGLTIDTRRVACRLDPPADPSSPWAPCAIEVDLHARAPRRSLAGWWTAVDDFVLTLAYSPERRCGDRRSLLEENRYVS